MAAMKGQDMSKYNEVADAHNFWVELDGILVAGFTEVSGLEAETEFDEYREGGVNGYVHKLAKGVRFPTLVLKRGLTKSPALWEWYESSIDGKLTRKSGSIVLQYPDGREFGRWNFFDAYPVKWIGPQLNAGVSDIAFEAVEIAHTGLYGSFNG